MFKAAFKRVEVYPTREEWLRGRVGSHSTRIGSSEVGAILGVDPWRSAWDVWLDRTFEVAPKRDTLRTRWGHYAEGFILQELSARTGASVVGHQAGEWVVAVHPNGWATCSPDGCAWHEGQWVGVEAKFYQDVHHWGDTVEGIPLHIQHQVYWQLAVTGLPKWFVAAASVDTFRTWVVDRDTNFQNNLLDRVGQWRDRHLLQGEQPEVSSAPGCSVFLKSRFPGGEPPREATKEEERMVQLAKENSRVAAQLAEDAKLLRNQLAEACGNAEYLILPSGGKWRPRRKNSMGAIIEGDCDPLDFSCLV